MHLYQLIIKTYSDFRDLRQPMALESGSCFSSLSEATKGWGVSLA